jgi:GMP synthase (glutamine-hydrolysing)
MTPAGMTPAGMSKTILLVDHPVGKREDRVSRLLGKHGYDIEWCCPGRGDALPAPNSHYLAVVVYGGTESANDGEDKAYIRRETDWVGRWVATGKPYLGLCLGGQLLARALGADVARHAQGLHEIGYTPVTPTEAGRDFLPAPLHAYQWHKEGFEVPAGAELLAEGEVFPNQAFRYGARTYGLQFHPEVSIPMMNRWMEEAGHMLAEPGAHPRDRQLADARVRDPPMAAWLEGFLARWLDGEG